MSSIPLKNYHVSPSRFDGGTRNAHSSSRQVLACLLTTAGLHPLTAGPRLSRCCIAGSEDESGRREDATIKARSPKIIRTETTETESTEVTKTSGTETTAFATRMGNLLAEVFEKLKQDCETEWGSSTYLRDFPEGMVDRESFPEHINKSLKALKRLEGGQDPEWFVNIFVIPKLIKNKHEILMCLQDAEKQDLQQYVYDVSVNLEDKNRQDFEQDMSEILKRLQEQKRQHIREQVGTKWKQLLRDHEKLCSLFPSILERVFSPEKLAVLVESDADKMAAARWEYATKTVADRIANGCNMNLPSGADEVLVAKWKRDAAHLLVINDHYLMESKKASVPRSAKAKTLNVPGCGGTGRSILQREGFRKRVHWQDELH